MLLTSVGAVEYLNTCMLEEICKPFYSDWVTVRRQDEKERMVLIGQSKKKKTTDRKLENGNYETYKKILNNVIC